MPALTTDTIRTAIAAPRRPARPLGERTDTRIAHEPHVDVTELIGHTGEPSRLYFHHLSVEPGGDRCR
ncbi:hypothetical protein [Streptomyces anulatus]|uniref:hypothetical protein n=1 Tax=Streptomyces anulatus TaxID=1892 RepID=UPI00386C79B1|nr:hypothetical protein OHB50_30765 [Streptomyces anulatus]